MINKKSILFLQSVIGDIYSVSKFNEWFQNIIYKIESKKWSYCLRVSKRNSPEHVKYEIDILWSLKNLPVIELESIDGEYIFSVEDKVAILYKYIDGCIQENNTPQELKIVGNFLGSFHISNQGVLCPIGHQELYNLSDKIIQKYQKYIYNSDVPNRELLPKVIAEIQTNRLSEMNPKGPIHVDFSPRNTLWNDGELAAVLDFDNAYHGPYILDIGKSIMFFASSHGEFDVMKARDFFDGYRQRRSLADIEKKEVYRAIKFAFLSHIFVDYYMFAKNVTTREYFNYIIHDLYISYIAFLGQLNSDPDFLNTNKPT